MIFYQKKAHDKDTDELISIYKRLHPQSSGSVQFTVSNRKLRETSQKNQKLCSHLLTANRRDLVKQGQPFVRS